MHKRKLLVLMALLAIVTTLAWPGDLIRAQGPPGGNGPPGQQKKITAADRKAAANRAAATGLQAGAPTTTAAMPAPGMTPDYFGSYPNYANSPFPASVSITGDGKGATATATVDLATGAITAITLTNPGVGYTFANVLIVGGGGTGATASATLNPTTGAVASLSLLTPGSGFNSVPGIRKFVDSLPGLGAGNKNDLGQYIPVAVPDQSTYPGSDFYVIELGRYTEQLHKDLPPTQLQGYRQINTLDPKVSVFSYLGPMILAQKDRPVRVKFINNLPTGTKGDLFLPTDTTVMGAGMGPDGVNMYTQNRATLHLHGGNTPWISDGTMHQWTTPSGENTPYPQGVSVKNVPDIDGGNEPQGTLTFYYTNQQSARLMFYHDHAYGITRLNVYAGEAAGYLLSDSAEQGLVSNGVIPSDQIPLIIQDKTFVPSVSQLMAEDPTWDTAKWGALGSLWFPHVYMPNQNPYDIMGANAMGRWDYGPWFWPPFTGLVNGIVPNPYYDPVGAPWEPLYIPGTPNPSIVPEGFMDTPLVNGTAYPYVQVGQKAYRFRILNASNDRSLNLQLYFAKSNATMWDAVTGALLNANAGEVNMVPATPGTGLPARWPTDGRDGGVPDPLAVGPSMIQIGTEGGFLPAPAVLPNTPVGYNYNRRDITVLNVSNKTLFLGPAERADVIVDFSGAPDGSKLILYNDAPAAVPAFDPRNDYYTGDPNQTDTGGAPSTLPGYGPNTRTVMQIQVSSGLGTAPAYNLAALQTALPAAYAQFQPPPIVPQASYNAAFNASYPADAYARIQDTTMSFFNGPLSAINVTNGGTGYQSAPAVQITGGGGTGATATAALAPRTIASVAVNSGGSGYTSAPAVSFSGGGGSGAAATAALTPTAVAAITVANGGKGYTSPPTVSFSGGGGNGAAATAVVKGGKVTAINLTSGGSGYTSAPTVILTGGGGTGAAATASLAPTTVASVTVTNGGSNYTSAPSVAFTGGGTGAAATATLSPGVVGNITLTNPGIGFTSAPTVNITGGGGSGAAAVAVGVVMDLQPKSIIEDFDVNYGRMNAMLGVEVPKTSANIQTSIPYYDADPPTEIFKNSDAAAPIGTLADGTQIWKITHNGVDTHSIHWHMFNVQLINRVGWDGMVKPPDANELGWKETVRMNPLEDVIVAMRPIIPIVPFDLPNSIRPLDVTMPLGSSLPLQFHNVDPTNEPATVTNQMVNFGWEYVWHCHLLGHEENIMMRPMAIAVAPMAPSTLVASVIKAGVRLTWTDTSLNETAFTVQRASSPNGPWTTIVVVQSTTGPQSGGTVTYIDGTVAKKSTYYYRVIANNVVGYTQTYAPPAAGYPNMSADSIASGSITVNT